MALTSKEVPRTVTQEIIWRVESDRCAVADGANRGSDLQGDGKR